MLVFLFVHHLATSLDLLLLSQLLVEERVEEVAALADLIGQVLLNPPGEIVQSVECVRRGCRGGIKGPPTSPPREEAHLM